MKKKLFLLVSFLLILFACENTDAVWDHPINESVSNSMVSRSFSYDLIGQLNGVPVNLKQVSSGKLLSVYSRGNSVVLSDSDDGSMRQRWYINMKSNAVLDPYLITLVGGNDEFNGGFLGRVNKVISEPYPILFSKSQSSFFNGVSLSMIPNTSHYSVSVVRLSDSVFPPIFPEYDYLQSKNSDNYALIFGNKINDGRAYWEIVPAEEFKIVGINYETSVNSQFSVSPKLIVIKKLINNTEFEATRTVGFEETLSTTSSFTETEGVRVSVSVSASVNIGIPSFGGGSIDTSNTTENSWSYQAGNSETKTEKISETVTQVLPPYTTLTAKLIAYEYKATVTYIAEMVGLTTGKKIYLKGAWSGVSVKESQIVLENDGTLVRRITVVPKSVN